ncbi:DUF397 domain-containing protein [Streptomyces sp. 7-21]|jgi:hypothetical protein|nr:DUF397 domain-containing protein [Streptomyces sp. 7-21]
MAIVRGETAAWVKSSYSAGQGACLEVRPRSRDLLAVRDSKSPAGPRLGFPYAAWSAFIGAVDGGALARAGHRR